MKADMKAFAALMRHIKSVDPVHTVTAARRRPELRRS